MPLANAMRRVLRTGLLTTGLGLACWTVIDTIVR